MKLTLNGPQALTIFPIAKDASIPSAAKSSSFATPQGYYCAESGELKLFIKGHEYRFLEYDKHEKLVSSTVLEDTISKGDTDHTEIQSHIKNLEERIECVEKRVNCFQEKLYAPLKAAFSMHEEI